MISISADYWNIKITDRIASLPDPVIFGKTTKYADLFIRNELTAAAENIFDRAPPFSNQGTTFQQGYDLRMTNPVGRALYVRGTYRF